MKKGEYSLLKMKKHKRFAPATNRRMAKKAFFLFS